jgi:hypothetical protein
MVKSNGNEDIARNVVMVCFLRNIKTDLAAGNADTPSLKQKTTNLLFLIYFQTIRRIRLFWNYINLSFFHFYPVICWYQCIYEA